MRKMISVILMLLLNALFTTTCVADDNHIVSVRGGITFDSTKEEIQQIESEQGSTYQAEGLWWTERMRLYDLYTNTVFAGIMYTDVIYHYNDEDQLLSILYKLPLEKDRSMQDNTFDTLYTALLKYGSPVANGSNYLPTNTDAIDVFTLINSPLFEDKGRGSYDSQTQRTVYERHKNFQFLDFAQWLVHEENNYVDIKLLEFTDYCYYADSSGKEYYPGLGGQEYHIALSYSFCTEEEIQEMHDASQAKQDQIDSDL